MNPLPQIQLVSSCIILSLTLPLSIRFRSVVEAPAAIQVDDLRYPI